MPMDRSKYPPDWEVISKRIRFERAGNRCEWCDAENYKPHPITFSWVVLTVAHLGIPKPDGSPGSKEDRMDCREENLAALCQRCHLNFDRPDNLRSARRKRQRKNEALDGLFDYSIQ